MAEKEIIKEAADTAKKEVKKREFSAVRSDSNSYFCT